jgi:hypothetical protein
MAVATVLLATAISGVVFFAGWYLSGDAQAAARAVCGVLMLSFVLPVMFLVYTEEMGSRLVSNFG